MIRFWYGWICFPLFLYREFQQCMNPTDGKVAAEHKDLAACFFNPVSLVLIHIFFQTGTRLKALLRNLSVFQEEADNFF